MLKFKIKLLIILSIVFSGFLSAADYYTFESRNGTYAVLKTTKAFDMYSMNDLDTLKDYCSAIKTNNGNWRLLGADFRFRDFFRKKDGRTLKFESGSRVDIPIISGIRKIDSYDLTKHKRKGSLRFKAGTAISSAPLCIATIHNGELQKRRVERPKLSGVDFNGNAYEEFSIKTVDLQVAISNGLCKSVRLFHNVEGKHLQWFFTKYVNEKIKSLYPPALLSEFYVNDGYRGVLMSRAGLVDAIKELDLSRAEQISCLIRNQNNHNFNGSELFKSKAYSSRGIIDSVFSKFKSDSVAWVNFIFMKKSGQLTLFSIAQSVPKAKSTNTIREEVNKAYNLKWAEAIYSTRSYYWRELNSLCSWQLDGYIKVNCLSGLNTKYFRNIEMPINEIPGARKILEEIGNKHLDVAIIKVEKYIAKKKIQKNDVVY